MQFSYNYTARYWFQTGSRAHLSSYPLAQGRLTAGTKYLDPTCNLLYITQFKNSLSSIPIVLPPHFQYNSLVFYFGTCNFISVHPLCMARLIPCLLRHCLFHCLLYLCSCSSDFSPLNLAVIMCPSCLYKL
jgi:hypothetical protein